MVTIKEYEILDDAWSRLDSTLINYIRFNKKDLGLQTIINNITDLLNELINILDYNEEIDDEFIDQYVTYKVENIANTNF